MPKLIRNLTAVFLAATVLCGCSTIVPKKPGIWPTVTAHFLWYVPERIASSEEAAANIKNLQNSIFFQDMNASSLDVDKYGMRAKLTWTETSYEKLANNTYEYGWWGLMSSSPSLTTYQTYKENLQKEKTIIIPFKEVLDIFLDADDNVYIMQKNGYVTQAKVSNAYDAKQLADSIYTLSIVAFGGELAAKTGMSIHELSPDQKQELRIDKGTLVIAVSEGSPAYHAGIQALDVITEVDGKTIRDAEQGLRLLQAIPYNKEIPLKFLRFKRSDRSIDLETFETKIKARKR